MHQDLKDRVNPVKGCRSLAMDAVSSAYEYLCRVDFGAMTSDKIGPDERRMYDATAAYRAEIAGILADRKARGCELRQAGGGPSDGGGTVSQDGAATERPPRFRANFMPFTKLGDVGLDDMPWTREKSGGLPVDVNDRSAGELSMTTAVLKDRFGSEYALAFIFQYRGWRRAYMVQFNNAMSALMQTVADDMPADLLGDFGGRFPHKNVRQGPAVAYPQCRQGAEPKRITGPVLGDGPKLLGGGS